MFQSTRHVRGATERESAARWTEHVSIHAPRAGRDSSAFCLTRWRKCFNPRAPCGARPFIGQYVPHYSGFQSTRPVRGATAKNTRSWLETIVSIHAPRAGRDKRSSDHWQCSRCFNPRAPCGARRTKTTALSTSPCFNPRAPCGARRFMLIPFVPLTMFQSTRPVRGATAPHNHIIMQHLSFNPRAPCGARPFAML